MPRWIPQQKWAEEDVFIIGGGPSLKTFDWSLLKRELTIGCNTAFVLGEDICKICYFGDIKWWHEFKEKLGHFTHPVFTSVPHLRSSKVPWLWYIPRRNYGLHTNAVGWNSNTGASAINLALILGAKNVYLLGMDLGLDKHGNPNWHPHQIEPANVGVYQRFREGFARVARDLPTKFPGCQIINLHDHNTLPMFPNIPLSSFWNNRKRVA